MQGIDVAETYLGSSEVKDEERLKEFFRSQSVHGDIYLNPNGSEADGQPWCAAFVNACEREAYGIQYGTGSLSARSFLTYGTHIDIYNAKVGDILVFDRGHNGYSGHVTYLHDIVPEGFVCLGGNQHDSVSKVLYTLSSLLAIRRTVTINLVLIK